MTFQLRFEKGQSIITGLAQAESPESVVRLFHGLTEMFRFSTFTVMIMPARIDKTISELILETSMPSGFYAEYDAVGGPDGCQLLEKLRSTILPVGWSIAGAIQRFSHLDRELPLGHRLYLKHGMLMGVAFPIATNDGSRYAAMYDGDREEFSHTELAELNMLTLRVFEVYNTVRVGAAGKPVSLTARELEVVRWTAAGKTSFEIGRIMNLSDHTINAYMNNAFKKLDCVSRTQLVAKALRLRVIS